MLWRPSYQTRVLGSLPLPRLEGRTLDGENAATPADGPLLGGFDARAEAELGVWRRLLEEASPDLAVPTVLIRPAWTARERRALRDAVAPARHARTLLADDPSEAWATALAPDRPERAFAVLMHDGVAETLMVGLPTEEAWDEFRGSLGLGS